MNPKDSEQAPSRGPQFVDYGASKRNIPPQNSQTNFQSDNVSGSIPQSAVNSSAFVRAESATPSSFKNVVPPYNTGSSVVNSSKVPHKKLGLKILVAVAFVLFVIVLFYVGYVFVGPLMISV